MQSINHDLHRNSTSGVAGVTLDRNRMWNVHWYENGQRKRKNFSISKYGGTEGAKQAAVNHRKMIEQTVPTYAEALYNRKKVVEKLNEVIGEEDWSAPMPELLSLLLEEDIDIEALRC